MATHPKISFLRIRIIVFLYNNALVWSRPCLSVESVEREHCFIQEHQLLMKGINQLKEVYHLVKEISIVRYPEVYDLFLLYYVLELDSVLLVCPLEM